MTMTDPIADMMARIRNGVVARKERVEVPRSRLKIEIAKILREEGYISDFREIDFKPQGLIEIDLKWSEDNRSVLSALKRISRPGRRVYVPREKIPRIRGGQGIAILTTSKGVLSDRDARRQGVGGEVICEVW